jgi:lysophospholipase L1-like esterase
MKGRSMNSSPPQIPVQPAPFEYDLPNLADAIEAAGSVKIVALGSSTTAGEGGIVAYPYRLEAVLRDKYANPRIDVINRGVGGEEAPKERDRIDRDVIAETPRLVIWQMGTNAVWQSRQDNPPSHDETIAALRQGIRRLRDERLIDIILMDPQYVPAMLTTATRTATDRMVSAIADVGRADKVNLFRRFELMKGWHEVAKISFDRLVDPRDDTRLHDSDWATQQLTEALGNLILARVPKPTPSSAITW